jgi:hypothetical protein
LSKRKSPTVPLSRDENPDRNATTLAVLSDSGSNINIIQQNDTKLWGIP